MTTVATRGFILSNKNMMLTIFSFNFKNFVENSFETNIKAMQSNWKVNFGLFINISNLLVLFTKFLVPMRLNKKVLLKRKHQHIVETGCALITHASIPHRFWLEAFSTIVYLINRLPTSTLANKSPYSLLFHCSPNYLLLPTFRSAY